MEGGDYWKVLSSTNPLTTVPQKQPNLCLVSKSFGIASLLGSMILKLTLSQLLILILLSGSITSKLTAGFDDFSIMIVRSNDFLIVGATQ